MRLKRIGSLLWMIMMPLLPFHAISAINKESSDVYLQNVMQELQLFNSPASHNQNRVSSDPISSISFHNAQNVKTFNNFQWRTTPDYQFDYNRYPGNQISIKKIDNDFLNIDVNNQIMSRPQKINKAWKGNAIGLTKNQLATMYENALKKGSPVGLLPLANSISSEKIPRVTPTHLEIPSPQYAYYFFPLNSFGNELRNNYGYKTIPDNVMEGSKVAETNKEMTNPLFVAVSSFIGMALIFMMGVLLFPKVKGFIPRDQNDDLIHLTKIVLEAVDNRNPLMGRSRKSFTGWSFRKRKMAKI